MQGQVVLCITIDTTWYHDTKVVALTLKFGIVGIDYVSRVRVIWPCKSATELSHGMHFVIALMIMQKTPQSPAIIRGQSILQYSTLGYSSSVT